MAGDSGKDDLISGRLEIRVRPQIGSKENALLKTTNIKCDIIDIKCDDGNKKTDLNSDIRKEISDLRNSKIDNQDICCGVLVLNTNNTMTPSMKKIISPVIKQSINNNDVKKENYGIVDSSAASLENISPKSTIFLENVKYAELHGIENDGLVEKSFKENIEKLTIANTSDQNEVVTREIVEKDVVPVAIQKLEAEFKSTLSDINDLTPGNFFIFS